MSTLWEIYFSISHSQNFLETPQTWFAGSDFLGNCWRCRISRNPYVNKGPEEGVENNDMSHVTVCSFCTRRCMSAWGTSYGAPNCSSLQGMNHRTAHTKLVWDRPRLNSILDRSLQLPVRPSSILDTLPFPSAWPADLIASSILLPAASTFGFGDDGPIISPEPFVFLPLSSTSSRLVSRTGRTSDPISSSALATMDE
jgi:hypothetical protein